MNFAIIISFLSRNIFAGALNLTHEEFHTTAAPTLLSSVGCLGSEDMLMDCSYSNESECGQLNDAGAICQGRIFFFIFLNIQI